jgi:hypothetical protein
MDIDVGILLTYQAMDLPCKELPWLLLKPLHHHSLVVFV